MQQRVGAYAVVVDGGQVLLAHWASRGIWTVPGGGIDPGEDPRDAAVREVAEETGYDVALDALLGVDSEVVPSVRAGAPDWHALRVVYRAHVTGGALRDEVDGSTDRAAWFPLDAVADLPRHGFVDEALHLAGLLGDARSR
ncbi:NUDIX hydrolase [Cellulomonas sp. CW35]|uniref:NUDIX hydrolase n=1 Tax=unclassified Cellulomonas TaxID=2620175 RepID=UPI000B8D2215|nr:NUDIX hydrolase [Cellulomonas sp. PSBB021]ASR56939.1 DNA mismatch repair protein MutT [Cellulomonas sp. PSBB021]